MGTSSCQLQTGNMSIVTISHLKPGIDSSEILFAPPESFGEIPKYLEKSCQITIEKVVEKFTDNSPDTSSDWKLYLDAHTAQ